MGVEWTIIVVAVSLQTIALVALVAFIACFGATAIRAAWPSPRTSPPPPADPTPCPACGHADHDYRLPVWYDEELIEQKAAAMRLVEKEVLPNFEHGTLTVPVAGTFPLDRAEEAYDRFESGGKLGKLVLLA